MYWYFSGLEKSQEVLLTHGDSIGKLAPNFKAIAHSGNIIAGMIYQRMSISDVIFHRKSNIYLNWEICWENTEFENIHTD
jgi:GMP synthase (glutamine-hydrolysing)